MHRPACTTGYLDAPVPDEEVSRTRSGCLCSRPEAGAETTGAGWRTQDALVASESSKETSPFCHSGTRWVYLNTGSCCHRDLLTPSAWLWVCGRKQWMGTTVSKSLVLQ